MKVAFVLSILALCAAANAEMYIVEAGKDGRKGPKLGPMNTNFCPTTYAKGFSIICKPSAAVSYVVFYVNTVWTRRENVSPYAINGDWKLNIFPYGKYPSGQTTIVCSASNGEKISGVVTFKCPEKPKPMKVEQKQGEPMKEPLPKAKTTDCAMIKGSDFIGDITPGWVKQGTAVAFRPWDNYGGVFPKGTSPLKYKFVAPMTGHYAVTLDMETKHITEHNDVWMKFQKGFTLRRGNSVKTNLMDWTKAYHNDAGRAKKAFSVDHDAHSFSTYMPLRQGMEYEFQLSGRSTKVKIYSLIFFPCEGSECQAGSKTWKKYLSMCK